MGEEYEAWTKNPETRQTLEGFYAQALNRNSQTALEFLVHYINRAGRPQPTIEGMSETKAFRLLRKALRTRCNGFIISLADTIRLQTIERDPKLYGHDPHVELGDGSHHLGLGYVSETTPPGSD